MQIPGKEVLKKYERFFMPFMLVAGLVFDFFLFTSIEIEPRLILLAAYFLIAGLAIAFTHYYDAPGILERGRIARFSRFLGGLAVQFSFGALLSNAFLFYWFSGEISVSWPFVLIIAVLMVSNDTLRHYFEEPMIQIGVYFFATFSFFAMALPYLFNSISAWLFVYAGILSLVYMFMYVGAMSRLVEHIRQQRYLIALPILLIYALMNIFYHYNVIPPIPLALREADVYHGVSRANGDYIVQSEIESWWQYLTPGQTVHVAPGEKIYVFASVFAPTKLQTTIVHDWQYYDPARKDWVSTDKISYDITGGRDGGYRGFSMKSSLTPGAWRVDVETKRGQVLGRVRFDVVKVEDKPELQTFTK